MNPITPDILQREIIIPTLKNFEQLKDECAGWLLYVFLPLLLVVPFFFFSISIVLIGSEITGLIFWGVVFYFLFDIAESRIVENGQRCFMDIYRIGSMEFDKALGCFVTMEISNKLIQKIRNNLVSVSGKSLDELKNINGIRTYNSAANILQEPIIPVNPFKIVSRDATMAFHSTGARQQNVFPTVEATNSSAQIDNMPPPREMVSEKAIVAKNNDRIIPLDLGD